MMFSSESALLEHESVTAVAVVPSPDLKRDSVLEKIVDWYIDGRINAPECDDAS